MSGGREIMDDGRVYGLSLRRKVHCYVKQITHGRLYDMIHRVYGFVRKTGFCFRNAILIALIIPTMVSAQERRLVIDTFHSVALEGNLLGDTADRNVIVYLPPSYNTDLHRRYPVVYLLHGNTARVEGTYNPATSWIKRMNINTLMDSLIRAKVVREMILAMPNGRNRYRGSHYVNSSVTGKWADYIARDLVQHIDSNYRTLPSAQSRGLAGCSMGGRGTLYLGMTYPDVFGVIYGLSSGEMNFGELSQPDNPESWSKLLQLQDISQAEWGMVRMIGLAAAFSPNPDRPPFFVDFQYELVDGTVRPLPEVFKKWQAYDPVALVSSSQANLQQLKAIRFDCGKSDGMCITGNRALAKALTAVGIPHIYEEYEGNHGNRWPERMKTKVLPFFSEVLAFTVSSK